LHPPPLGRELCREGNKHNLPLVKKFSICFPTPWSWTSLLKSAYKKEPIYATWKKIKIKCPNNFWNAVKWLVSSQGRFTLLDIGSDLNLVMLVLNHRTLICNYVLCFSIYNVLFHAIILHCRYLYRTWKSSVYVILLFLNTGIY